MEHLLRWGLLALLILVLGYMGVGLFVAARLTTSVRQLTEQTPAAEGLVFQEVGFESSDGLPLKEWYDTLDGEAFGSQMSPVRYSVLLIPGI